MTRAPKSIKELAALWVDQGGRNLGIVGDTKHKQRGTSYHLGRGDLKDGAYSVTLKRDRKGLSEAASALDLGKLDGRIGKLRKFSNWLVDQAEAGLTPDIREIIWSPDGNEVRRWDSHLDRVIVSLRRHKDNTIHVVNAGNGDATTSATPTSASIGTRDSGRRSRTSSRSSTSQSRSTSRTTSLSRTRPTTRTWTRATRAIRTR